MNNSKVSKKLILIIAAIILVIGTIVTLFAVLSKPSSATVFASPINEEEMLIKIVQRINEENIKLFVNSGFLLVKNEEIARRIRTILIMDDLVPPGLDPWSVFNRGRWTITDFIRDVNFRRNQERMIIEHLKTINDIEDISLAIAWPDYSILHERPVTASVSIKPKPGSDITLSPQNRLKIEGIKRIVMYAIPLLTSEYISITDYDGYSLVSCNLQTTE